MRNVTNAFPVSALFAAVVLADAAVAQGSGPYCHPGGGIASCKMDPWIRRTQFVTIDHAGSCGPGYEDLTALSAAVLQGAGNPIFVSSNNTPDTGFVRVYVDWNQDFDFLDAGEENILANFGSLSTGTIAAPANALLGPTRMRVAVGNFFGTPPSACWGMDTKDFTVVVCTDNDGDGVLDCSDNCPLPNPSQADCDGNGIGDACEIANGTQSDCNSNGIPDNCEIDCNLTGKPDDCDIAAGTSLDVNANGVPDECEASHGVPFCFGDASLFDCPCGNSNNGASVEGCINSTGRGARLYNSGGTSVSADDAAPTVIQSAPSKPLVFIAGAHTINFGFGTPLYDGLLCIQPYRRYPIQTISSGGTATLTGTVQQANGLITPGATVYFQAWFRDGAGSPCGTHANLSNALQITFGP